MEIDARAVAQTGWDLQIDRIGTTGRLLPDPGPLTTPTPLASPVPEPGSLWLGSLGLLALGLARRRRAADAVQSA